MKPHERYARSPPSDCSTVTGFVGIMNVGVNTVGSFAIGAPTYALNNTSMLSGPSGETTEMIMLAGTRYSFAKARRAS